MKNLQDVAGVISTIILLIIVIPGGLLLYSYRKIRKVIFSVN